MTLRVFPVLGGARISGDFGAPRSGGGRAHQGNDLFAPDDTPLVAVDDGTIAFGVDPLGGNVAVLRSADGARYYYAHLSAYEGGSRAVRAGEVIGYLGRTGNAISTDPHLHFEVHPGGGAAIDPAPALTQATVLQPSASGGRRILLPLALAVGAGLGAWWLTDRASAEAFFRRT